MGVFWLFKLILFVYSRGIIKMKFGRKKTPQTEETVCGGAENKGKRRRSHKQQQADRHYHHTGNKAVEGEMVFAIFPGGGK